MARILIVAGGCRGRRLAATMVHEGHAARVSTRTEATRAAIEAAGAECWVGTPDRLGTLRGALENVTVICWLLGCASGSARSLRELHTTRLELFLTQVIDTTARGFVYEARGAPAAADLLRDGQEIVRAIAERNAIPTAFLTADPRDPDRWLKDARAAVASLLGSA
ncbi:MAG TPA: hypothetical protein VMF09_10775 [Solirubrobacteraceae bacterium]|nr:hypothetical protein [Solirubrobacteraceae bacterium]